MQEKLKIKRCPCCGGDALLTVLANSNGRITAWVRCEDCGLGNETVTINLNNIRQKLF